MEAYINGKVRELRVVSKHILYGKHIVIGIWMYKDKEQVFYAFQENETYGAVCNGNSYTSVLETATHIAVKYGKDKPLPIWTIKKKINSYESTYIRLKLLQIIR